MTSCVWVSVSRGGRTELFKEKSLGSGRNSSLWRGVVAVAVLPLPNKGVLP